MFHIGYTAERQPLIAQTNRPVSLRRTPDLTCARGGGPVPARGDPKALIKRAMKQDRRAKEPLSHTSGTLGRVRVCVPRVRRLQPTSQACWTQRAPRLGSSAPVVRRPPPTPFGTVLASGHRDGLSRWWEAPMQAVVTDSDGQRW